MKYSADAIEFMLLKIGYSELLESNSKKEKFVNKILWLFDK